jgi:hypothetical protein
VDVNDETAHAADAPEWRLARLVEGFLTTQLLYVAAKLGVADVLAAGPGSGETIAAAVGAEPDALARILRGLVLEDVLFETADGRFALTEVGEFLRDDVPGSLRRAVIARGELYYDAATGLMETVRDGGPAFEHVHGEPFFDHLARDPAREDAFQGSMAARSEREAADVVSAYDFGLIRNLVDVGGGQGILLGAILRAAPEPRAILFDRPAAVAEARERLEAGGLAGRCECVGGDFFERVPDGAEAYLLSRVLHDWDDGDAARILGSCREAMTEKSLLLIVEAILPERARDRPAAIWMDLLMLLLFGTRERTEAEFAQLLAGSGFRITRVAPTPSPAGHSELESVPSP